MERSAKDEALRSREVPGIAGRGLVVPKQFPGIRLQCEDAGEIEIVAGARITHHAIPRRTVAGADIQNIRLRIVGQRIPHRATASCIPAFRIDPGLAHLFQRIVRGGAVLSFRGIARHRVEAPCKFSGLGVIGRYKAACAELGAAKADNDLALHHTGCAGDGLIVILRGLDGPDFLAGLLVQCNQPAVEHAHKHLAIVERHTTIIGSTAEIATEGTRYLGVEAPPLDTGLRIDREHHAPTACAVDDAIGNQWCGLKPTICLRGE